MKALKISFCTVSMNRLHHLRLTLPQNIIDNMSYENVEFIVIDYNSTDGLSEWALSEMKGHLESGLLKIYRTEEPVYFHRCHSRNMAFKQACGDVLCNIDADNYIGPSFANYINENLSLNKERFLTANYTTRDSMGRLCVRAADFHRIRGYNEALAGYGYDDVDIYHRLALTLKQHFIHNQLFLKVIKHEHADRFKNEYLGVNISNIYIAYLKPYLSELIFRYRNGMYERGQVIDNELAPGSVDDKINLVGSWYQGDWRNFLLADKDSKFYKVTSKMLFEEILLLRTEIDNRKIHLAAMQRSAMVNPDGYGAGCLTLLTAC